MYFDFCVNIRLSQRSTTAKTEKVDSLHVPTIKSKGLKQLVFQIILKNLDFSEYVKFKAISSKFAICQ